MKRKELEVKLKNKGLRVTIQRMAVLEAVLELNNHPTAEDIIGFIKIHNPIIAVGTVYKVLDTLVENGLIKKVKTDKEIMRYDGILSKHHHLHCSETEKIIDFYDEKIDKILESYFKEQVIPNFEIKEIKLLIDGKLITKDNKINKK